VEVLASVVLLAVVLSISLSVFPNMFKTNSINEESLDAVAVAKDALVRAKDGELLDEEFVEINNDSKIKDYFPSNTGPQNGYYTFSKPSDLNSTATLYYVIDRTKVDGLELYEITIYVVERSSIRATNYGYLDADSLPLSLNEDSL